MSVPDPVAAARARWLLALGAACVLLAGWLLVQELAPQEGLERHPRSGLPLLEDAPRLISDISEVEVQLADESYRLVRADGGWRMDGPTGYRVRADRMGEFLKGLETLSWAEARTRDPRKLDRLGLSDPGAGGNGAAITLRDATGDVVATFIAGHREDTLYVRRRDEALAFRAGGDLPPLQGRSSWLDFDVLSIVADAIRGVELAWPNGETLTLIRAPGGGPRDFIPGPPHSEERLVSRLAAASPALTLSRFAPVGVKPADALETDPVARHTTLTRDGLEVIATAYAEPDGYFVTLRAAASGEGARRAAEINTHAGGWAFRLTRYDWGDFAPAVSEIIERPLVEAP